MIEKRADNNKNIQMRGHFLTSQRQILLELIREAEGHLDAKELYQRAHSSDESIAPATVYRNLNLFKQLGASG